MIKGFIFKASGRIHYKVLEEIIANCCVPYDHIPMRSYPLFKARAILERILSSKGNKVKCV